MIWPFFLLKRRGSDEFVSPAYSGGHGIALVNRHLGEVVEINHNMSKSHTPPKPLAIETRLVLSMLYQVKDRLEIKRWMKPQDIFEAHRRLFDQIEDRCQRDYGYPATVTHHIKAIEILMEGFNPDDILP